jgi:hypothetical protein
MARTGPILEKCDVTADVFLAFVFNNRHVMQVDPKQLSTTLRFFSMTRNVTVQEPLSNNVIEKHWVKLHIFFSEAVIPKRGE